MRAENLGCGPLSVDIGSLRLLLWLSFPSHSSRSGEKEPEKGQGF